MLSRNLARTQNRLPQVKPRPGRARPPGSSARRALPIAHSVAMARSSAFPAWTASRRCIAETGPGKQR